MVPAALTRRLIAVPLLWALYQPARAASLSGAVRDGQGRPVAKASVYFTAWSDLEDGNLYLPSWAAGTDGQGRYRLAGLPDGATGYIRVTAGGKAFSIRDGEHGRGRKLGLGSGASSLDLTVTPANALRVRFRPPSGYSGLRGSLYLPDLGIWVPFAGQPLPLEDLPAGKLNLRYKVRLFGPGNTTVDMPESGDKDTTIDLKAPNLVEGAVFGADSLPLAGVKYHADGDEMAFGVTGQDGRYQVTRSDKGAVAVTFRHHDYSDTVISIGKGSGAGPSLYLAPAGEPITGRIARYREDSLRGCGVTTWVLPEPGRPAVTLYGSKWRIAPDGSFRIPAMSRLHYELALKCEERYPRDDTVRGGQDMGEVALERADSLRGQVVDRATGKPIPDFQAFAIPGRAKDVNPRDFGWMFGGRPTRHFDEGRFSLSAAAKGDNALCVSAPAHFPACADYRSGYGAPAPQILELGPGASLAVHVRGPRGPAKGVSVLVASDRYNAGPAKLSDSSGTAAFTGMMEGQYTVIIRDPAYVPWVKTLGVHGDQDLDADLDPGRAIRARVWRADGTPAKDLQVSAHPRYEFGDGWGGTMKLPLLLTDGKLDFRGLSDEDQDLCLLLPWTRSTPYVPLYRVDGLRPGAPEFDIRLPPSRTWEIRAYYAGKPVKEEGLIRINLPPQGDSAGSASGRTWGVAEGMAFREYYGLPAFTGVRYMVRLDIPGYRTSYDSVLVTPGGGPLVTRVELYPSPFLRARLRPYDSAVSTRKYRLELETDAENAPGADVGDSGAVFLPKVPGGAFPLVAWDKADNWHPAWIGYGQAGAGAVFAIRPPGTIAGRVAGQARGKRARFLLRRREAAGGWWFQEAFADGLGRFRFDGVPPGAYRVCPDEGAPCASATVAPGGADSVVIPLTAAHELEVRYDWPAAFRGQGQVQLGDRRGLQSSRERDMGQRLPAAIHFPVAAQGPARVYVAGRGPGVYLVQRDSLRLDARGTRVAVDPAPGAVRVRVRDAHGKPVIGATILLQPDGEGWDWTPPPGTTDQAGELLYLGLRPGGYRAYLRHPGLALAPQAFRLPAADTPVALDLRPAAGPRLKVKAHWGREPLAGAQVWVYDSTGREPLLPGPAATDESGLADCGALPPVTCVVRMAAETHALWERKADARPGRPLTLDAEPVPAGWVEIAGGAADRTPEGYPAFALEPAKGAPAPLYRKPLPDMVLGDSAATPAWLSWGVPPGEYRLRDRAGGHAPVKVTVEAGKVSPVRWP